MPGVVGIVLRVALLNDLAADLEEGFLELRNALAGLDFEVNRAITEFVPEIGIGNGICQIYVFRASLQSIHARRPLIASGGNRCLPPTRHVERCTEVCPNEHRQERSW